LEITQQYRQHKKTKHKQPATANSYNILIEKIATMFIPYSDTSSAKRSTQYVSTVL
jgi:hypothetical protein